MARRIRCAIYTRKSSEEGLDQDFNSLDAQAEACAAYVASQKAEGWVLVPTRYDDGGLSGGTLERPALQRLLADIEAGLVDQIVVYKIDRLTRSLSDFAKIVDRLDAAGASFVSVTQSFNTATSMGRLTLNMLLSFAQFEREVTAERIRDKIAASKKKGLWKGGTVPFGYQPDGRSLKIGETEAPIIRHIHDLYRQLGSIRLVAEEAGRLGYRTRARPSVSGIDSAARRISTSFQMRRRGFEARIILGAAVPQVDPVLAKNILAARRWYAAIKAGASFGDLATREKTTTRRIRQMIGLAFLAPDLLDQVAAGRQPVAFTSEWIKRRQLPAGWDQQRQTVGGL